MTRLLLLVLVAVSPSCLIAGDWPQFLGPNRDSVSDEKIPVWTTAPKLLWKQPVGDAHSSPVVAKGVVYAFFKPNGQDADALTAFEAATGKKLWEKSYTREKFTPPYGLGPRGTPVVENGKVYTLGNTGVLACWNCENGELVWKVETLKEFMAKNLFFGVSTSPTIVGNNVVVMVGGKGAGVVAFDKGTGKVAWKATDDPASYASPLLVGQKRDRIVFLTGSHLRALSADGQSLWEFPFKDRLNESSTTPVKVGDIVIGGSVTAGSVALKVNKADEKHSVEQVWRDEKLTCYFSTPVVVGPHLYMVNGAATIVNPSITLRCVEAATGKVLWAKEKIGKYHAALVRSADDKLLMLDDVGNLVLLQPDPKEYKELCRAKVCGPSWAHPAISEGRVFVRDEKVLVCVKPGE